MLTTVEKLKENLPHGETNKVVERFDKFARLPNGVVEDLAACALNENWGTDYFVLRKYLAVTVPWAIEQGRVTFSQNQFYVSAGSLQTRYGTPLYLVFEKNKSGSTPWFLKHAGSNIAAPDLPLPPSIPCGPDIARGAEVVMMHDHILGDNADRVVFLAQTPPVAQMCAVSGAIQWSLYRNLELPYWYYGKVHYLVPLYLQSRENITLAPDLVAPVEASGNNLLVRTVLEAHMPYANARVVVKRHDQLPPWLLDCWNKKSNETSAAQMDDPEGNLS